MDLLDTYREMCADLRDYCMSVVNNRMNEVMKVLTVIATIFIPLSFLAGLYGMNFEYMPGLKWPFSYPLLLMVMCGIAGGLLATFWRRGWLHSNERGPDPPSGR